MARSIPVFAKAGTGNAPWPFLGIKSLRIVLGLLLLSAIFVAAIKVVPHTPLLKSGQIPQAMHHHLLVGVPRMTQTKHGRPADPINIGLVGTEEELLRALNESGWVAADPITLRSSLKIAGSVLLNRPYSMAPVSNQYLWGRTQDLAFERMVGKSARRRHHVRFWSDPQRTIDGRPLWLGAATYDESVGISRSAGITHHIAWDVDQERDVLVRDLNSAGRLSETFQVVGLGSFLPQKNGGSDSYCSDGLLTVGVISLEDVL